MRLASRFFALFLLASIALSSGCSNDPVKAFADEYNGAVTRVCECVGGFFGSAAIAHCVEENRIDAEGEACLNRHLDLSDSLVEDGAHCAADRAEDFRRCVERLSCTDAAGLTSCSGQFGNNVANCPAAGALGAAVDHCFGEDFYTINF